MPLCIETKVEMTTPAPVPFMFGPDRGAFLREFLSAFAYDVQNACDEVVLPDSDDLHWWMSVEFHHDRNAETREHTFNTRMLVWMSSSMWVLVTSSPSAEAEFFRRVFERFEEKLQGFATREFDKAKDEGALKGCSPPRNSL